MRSHGLLPVLKVHLVDHVSGDSAVMRLFPCPADVPMRSSALLFRSTSWTAKSGVVEMDIVGGDDCRRPRRTAARGPRDRPAASPVSTCEMEQNHRYLSQPNPRRFIVDSAVQEMLHRLDHCLAVGAAAVLLHGPSGTGKSALCEHFARSRNRPLIRVIDRLFALPATDLSEQGSLLAQLRRLTAQAALTGSLLLVEDIDCLVTDGASFASSSLLLAWTAFLQEIHQSNRRRTPETASVLVLATSRNIERVDKSLRRTGCIGVEVMVDLPDSSRRLFLLQSLLGEESSTASAEWIALLACRQTVGYSLSDLQELRRQVQEEGLSIERALHLIVPSSRRAGDVLRLRKSQTQSAAACAPGAADTGDVDGIVGCDEAKLALRQALLWPLMHPQIFQRMNISSTKGVLLYGPPGAAKTTLIRSFAAAADARVAFIVLSAAEVYSPYVGQSELTLRTAFRRARQLAPSVIFLDEIDGMVGGRSADISARVLSTLLNEMDGIESSGNADPQKPVVVVVGATNRPWVLDAALLRPGRFDAMVYVKAPGSRDRCKLLLQLGCPAECAGTWAETITAGWTGAELQHWHREAAMHLLRETLPLNSTEEIPPRHWLATLHAVRPVLTREMELAFEQFAKQAVFHG